MFRCNAMDIYISKLPYGGFGGERVNINVECEMVLHVVQVPMLVLNIWTVIEYSLRSCDPAHMMVCHLEVAL